ncbi:hypothetical protein [Treponema sp.]|uniref:hypothetical protein n=1 Tax=Treponema sp. TaxID=166 RepID=UPI003890B117
MKHLIVFLAAILFSLNAFSDGEIKHNPWELFIYRPENSEKMNEVRCWLKIEDMDGNDVTYTATKAHYIWISNPKQLYQYERTYYLSGGMAMYLHSIKPGRYRFTVCTPADKQYPYPNANRDWTSNEFIYDTNNPAKVIFVFPTADDNGFYDGGWTISGKAPKFFKFTKPKMKP